MTIFRLRDAVDKVIREEECGSRNGRVCVDQIFILRLMIDKCLNPQTSLVPNFIDYEQVSDSFDIRALVKVLSFYGPYVANVNLINRKILTLK